MKLNWSWAFAVLLFVSAIPLQADAGRKAKEGPSCAAGWARLLPEIEAAYVDLFGSGDDEHDSDMATIHARYMAYCQSHGVASATDKFRHSYTGK